MTTTSQTYNDLEDYFNDIIKLNPTFAFNIGIKSDYIYSHYENTYSDEYINKFKKILHKYKNTKDISLNYCINNNLQILKYPFHLLPLYSFENPIINFDYANKELYPKNIEFLKSRIKDFDDIVDTYIMRMSEGIKKNITIPKIICKKIIKDLSKPEYKKRYKILLLFLKNKYLHNCQNKIGLCHLNGGKNMYKLLIRNYCKYYISPVTIHKYGIKEVKKLYSILKKQKYPKKIYCKSIKELLNLYKKNYQHIKNTIMPKYFNYITKKECKIIKINKSLESSMPLAYYNELLNTFYLNIKNLNLHEKNDILSLTMHETIPGHHYQFYYMAEKKLPLYKIYGIDNTAFVEGWALYSETLGPQNKGSITAQLFRAVRLVVDTGIHYYGWSFKKAFNYMKKYISYSNEEIKMEIYRYISLPGQAVTYYLGKKYILKLRYLYVTKYNLGNIKDFHDFILEDGVVTFDYLMKKLNTHIAKIK